jgi:guanylate kinase
MKKIVLIGPSGTGKSTVADKLTELYGLTLIQSYTTRPKRFENETGHTFVDEFVKDNNIITETYFNGNYYWITLQQFEKGDMLTLDKAGVENLGKYREDCFVVGLTCAEEELRRRIPDRIQRIEHDKEEFRGYKELCNIIIDTTDVSVEDIAFEIMLRFTLQY